MIYKKKQQTANSVLDVLLDLQFLFWMYTAVDRQIYCDGFMHQYVNASLVNENIIYEKF